MPWYDYRCEACDATLEVRRSMSDGAEAGPPACPECGSRETRRIFGNVFAGTGGCEPGGKG